MSRTIAVHVRYNSWYMSLPSSAKQQREMTKGAYHSTKNFETGTNGTEISWEKFQETRKLLNFRKANHSTEDSGMKVKGNGNFQEKIIENLGIPHEVVLFFQNLCKFPIFYSAPASSFGRDHRELDILRKEDGNAHSIKETL